MSPAMVHLPIFANSPHSVLDIQAYYQAHDPRAHTLHGPTSMALPLPQLLCAISPIRCGNLLGDCYRFSSVL